MNYYDVKLGMAYDLITPTDLPDFPDVFIFKN